MSECPTPWKPVHPNPQTAYRAAEAYGMSHYHCPCGGWHLTTPETAKQRNAARASKARYRDKHKVRRARAKLFGRTGRQRNR